MANWNTIIENYESNDCESLGEYAAELMHELMNYFNTYLSSNDSGFYSVLCALYFVNLDGFVDGGEEDVIRYAINDFKYEYNIPLMRKNFNDNGYSRVVERHISDAPRQIREYFVRLGCAILSGKGYISDSERKAILKWI